jgi:dTDP-4-dehydrorhamnose reductase
MKPCKAADFPMKAPRPERTPLENKRLNELGISVMRDYQESVREFLMVHKEE